MRDSLVRALRTVPGSIGRKAAYLEARSRLEAGLDAPRLDRLVAALVTEAETALGRGRDEKAAEALTKALTLLFHPARARGAEVPALLADPAAVLRVLDGGMVGQVLGRGAPSAPGPPVHTGVPAVDGDATRPRRVLVVTGGGLSFLSGVIAAWRDAGAIVETLEVGELPSAERPTLATVVGAAIGAWRTGRPTPVPAHLAARLEDIDHIHVEWGDQVAAWLSRLDPAERSLSVRVHKYEILTAYPQLIDAEQVDTLCFVAPHVRDAALAIAPGLARARRIDVTSNALELDRFADATPAPDLPAALPPRRCVLGLVGWAGPAKDADWALDVLDALGRLDDDPWTLLLVGPEPEVRGGDAERARRLLERIARAGDRVIVLGRREDVPSVLAHVGWIVSSSVIEGTHEAVAEGAAAGCVPIVRDWPQVRAYGGAGTVYPRSWLVQDPEHAARKILGTVPDRDGAARAATVWVREDRDPRSLAAAQGTWLHRPYDHELRGESPRDEGGTA